MHPRLAAPPGPEAEAQGNGVRLASLAQRVSFRRPTIECRDTRWVWMNVVVCAKYVPNPNGIPELGDDNLLKREGVEGALDPGDEYGVEAGLQIADAQGGEVTVVSMGPEPASAAVRKALSMGAHRAVFVTDGSLRGSDALATARVLAAAIKRQEFDLVIASVESTDGSTGTLPMTVAELLGVPSVTFARQLEVADGQLRVERQTEAGYDVVECPLPAVV